MSLKCLLQLISWFSTNVELFLCPWCPPVKNCPGSDSWNRGSSKTYLQTHNSVDLVVVEFLWVWGRGGSKRKQLGIKDKKKAEHRARRDKKKKLPWEKQIGWDFGQSATCEKAFGLQARIFSLWLDACLMPSTEQNFAKHTGLCKKLHFLHEKKKKKGISVTYQSVLKGNSQPSNSLRVFQPRLGLWQLFLSLCHSRDIQHHRFHTKVVEHPCCRSWASFFGTAIPKPCGKAHLTPAVLQLSFHRASSFTFHWCCWDRAVKPLRTKGVL